VKTLVFSDKKWDRGVKITSMANGLMFLLPSVALVRLVFKTNVDEPQFLFDLSKLGSFPVAGN